MTCNKNFVRPSPDGTSLVFAPVAFAPELRAPTEADYNARGWYRNAIEPPAPPEGKTVASTRYEIADGKCVAVYTYADIPAAPRTFSKLKIVAALMQAEVWEQVKQYIIDAGLYDLYLAAQDFREDNDYFLRGKSVLMSQLGWDNAQVESILAASVAEGAA